MFSRIISVYAKTIKKMKDLWDFLYVIAGTKYHKEKFY